MRSAVRLLAASACVLASAPALAQASPEALAWLQRLASAARETSYMGTVLYAAGERTSTSRVVHAFRDGAEVERIVALDGPRQEIVRVNDRIQCFYPDAKTVRVDRRVSARFFPSVLLAAPEVVAESYRVRLGAVERVAGMECQWISLEPKDAYRFAHRLCAHVATGLPLRAATLGPPPRNAVFEQYTFTDIRVGTEVPPRELRVSAEPVGKDWRREGEADEELRPASTGWSIPSAPPGFRLVHETQRRFPGKPHAVSQLVLSDGLAALSVFIEPIGNAAARESLTQDGGLSVYTRALGDHRVTVLGEVPPASVQYVGRNLVRAAAGAR